MSICATLIALIIALLTGSGAPTTGAPATGATGSAPAATSGATAGSQSG